MLRRSTLTLAVLPALLAARSVDPALNAGDDPTISDVSNEVAITSNSSTIAEVNEYLKSHRILDGEMSTMSGCEQGPCPDFDARVDLFTWGFNYWWVRINDCGECHSKRTSSDGCVDITTCGRRQSICIDRGRSRMHRIWTDIGARECYRVEHTVDGTPYCGTLPGGFPARPSIWTQRQQVDCSW